MIFKLNEIKNNTYSTKETITYFIVGYYNTKSNDTKTIIKSIINQMIKIPQNEILNKSFCGFLNIYGKDMLKIPMLGYLQDFLATQGGWIICILFPCLGVISYDIVKLAKGIKKRKKIKVIK